MSKMIDEVGNRHNMLVVIKRARNLKNGKAMWFCKCDCGKSVTVEGTNLRSGNTKSCGSKSVHYALPKGEASFNYMVRNIQTGAKYRNFKWDLSKREVKRITSLSCHYCGAPPSNILKGNRCNGAYTYNGIDRIDNLKGYTVDNVVPCCWNCNRAKGILSVPEFEAWIEQLIAFRNKKG